MKVYWNRALAILLAATMAITMISETSVTAFAAATAYAADIESEGETAVYGLQAADADSGEEISDKYESRTIEYSGTNATALRLSIMTKTDEKDGWQQASANVGNVKLTVDKNAKIIDKSKSSQGVYTILLSKKSAKVTLTYKDAAGTTKKDEYTILNNTFAETKAPKLKASGTLYANYTAKSQKISYQVTGGGYTEYTDGTRHAKIELDAVSLYSKNQKVRARYNSLASSLGYSVGTVNVEKDGSFVLDFKKLAEENWTGISAGSYKLWITFGYYGEDGTFIPETKSQAVTLKAAAPAKASYKPVTSVKMSATDKASVRLAGSGKNYDAATVKYTNLRNADNAGESNQFTTYFALDDDNNLTLQSAAINQVEYLTGKAGKVHCTGYVDYSYQGVNGLTYSGTTKITVKLSADKKTVDKYSAAKTTIVKESAAEKQTATVNILAGKQDAELLAAVIVTPDTPFSLADNGVNGSKITLKYGDEIKTQKYDVTLKVLPKNSLYASEYDAKDSETDKNQVVIERGIEVKASITVKEKAGTKGKISVASKDRTQTFLNSQYDSATQSYWVKVPYKAVIPCDITEIQADDSVKDMISLAAEDGYIVISLDKEKFTEQIDENGKFKGKNKPEKTKISVKATVKFDGSADETITFKLTLPKEPSTPKYDLAVEQIEQNRNAIASAVTLTYRTDMTGLDENGAPAELTFTGTMKELSNGEHEFLASVYDAVQNSLYDAIRAYASQESNVDISFQQITTDRNGQITVSLAAGDFTQPSRTAAGSLIVTAVLTDGSKTGEAQTASQKTVTFELTIPKTGEQPADAESALKEFVDNIQTYNYTITNETTASEIANMAYREVIQGKPQYASLRIRAEIDKEKSVDATQAAPGCKQGTLTVYGTRYGGSEVSVDFNFEIDRVKSIEELKEAALKKIKAAIGIGDDGTYDMTVINELAKSNNKSEVGQAFLTAAQAAVANDSFEVKMDQSTFTFEPATYRESGSIRFTLTVQSTSHQEVAAEEIEFAAQAPVQTIQTIEEAYADVQDAMNGFEVAPSDTAPTEETLTAAVQAHLAAYDNGAGAVIAGSGITAEVTSQIITAPTQSEAGQVKITVSLSKQGSEEPRTYELIRTIPKLKQTLAQSKAAVEALAQDSTLAVNNEDYTRIQWKQNKLLTAAQSAVDTDAYTVAVTKALEITKSTLQAEGSATITFTITDNSSGEEENVTLTWVIPMVVARYICSCGYSTYSKSDLSSHIIEGAKLGETHSYTTDYEYASDTDAVAVQQSNELVDLE
jgi:hypothetical protein